MGSIAMDKLGNIALGHSASSGSAYPSIRYTGRLATDALGTMQTKNIVQAGSGSQNGNLHRSGDYSAMTVDPVDDCTFWYTTEYQKATGSFNCATWIASFKFPGSQWRLANLIPTPRRRSSSVCRQADVFSAGLAVR